MALPVIDDALPDRPETVDSRRPRPVVEVVAVVRPGDVWVSCPSCGMDVRAEALDRHRATQH